MARFKKRGIKLWERTHVAKDMLIEALRHRNDTAYRPYIRRYVYELRKLLKLGSVPRESPDGQWCLAL